MQWSVLQNEMCSQPSPSSQEMHCQVELERLYWEQSEQEYHQQLQVRLQLFKLVVFSPDALAGMHGVPAPALASLPASWKPLLASSQGSLLLRCAAALQEYYILRQQHQLKQQRLNQVLYGHAAPQWPVSAAAAAHQQHHSATPAHYMDVMMAAASPAREPLQPMHHQFNFAFQQQQQLGGGGFGVKVAPGGQPMDVGHVQLIGTKRCSDVGVGELATQGTAGLDGLVLCIACFLPDGDNGCPGDIMTATHLIGCILRWGWRRD